MKKETKKEWFLDRYCGKQFAALVENGKPIEFFSEKEPRGACVGNVYKGKVVNVLSGMNAAFVNCGLARNCYLSLDDTFAEHGKYDGTMSETNQKSHALKEGDEVVVQLTQLARGNKGAKVSTHLSFVARDVIYLPNTSFLGISRKITDEAQRELLLGNFNKMRETEEEGFIVRTQAPLASQKQLKAEIEHLKKMYLDVRKAAKVAPVGTLLYETEDLPLRVMRDCAEKDIDAFRIGDETLYNRLRDLLRKRKDIPERKLVKYTGQRSLFQEYGITSIVDETTQATVPLENGGYLVIEPTEAMTVVDVNTGSFVGDHDLEETVFETNLVAAKEIARQVRLRNVGGIVVVDFIDMTEEAHKLAVTEELKKYLALDNAKCNVLPMSELCLTQFTRKRVGNDVQSQLVKACPCCGGSGHVPEDIAVVTRIRAELLDCFANGYTAAIVELNERIMKKILSEGLFSIEVANRWKDKRIYLIPHKTYREDHFTIRGDTAKVLSLPDKAQILY